MRGLLMRTRVWVFTFTTEGVTRLSTGASDGNGSPSTAMGKAAIAGPEAKIRAKQRYIPRKSIFTLNSR
ncbi:hypothetical protein ACFL1J_05860 [Pseudomonadota bacterium]